MSRFFTHLCLTLITIIVGWLVPAHAIGPEYIEAPATVENQMVFLVLG